MSDHLVPLIFLVVGLALAVGGIYWLQRTRAFAATAARASGTITGVEERRSSKGSSTWAPVIRFKDAVGREVVFTANFSTSGMRSRVGKPVEVLYDPQDSSSARMGGGMALYMGPAVVGGMGVVFAAIALSILAASGSFKVFQAPRGSVGELAGRWENIDSRTPGITRVAISSGEVRVWGKCHPQDCDWGTPASYDRVDAAKGGMTLTWDHKFARRNQQITLLPDGRLQVDTQTRFVDRSGRQDRETTEYFVRTAQ